MTSTSSASTTVVSGKPWMNYLRTWLQRCGTLRPLYEEPDDWFTIKPSDLLKVGLPNGWTGRRREIGYGSGSW